MQEKYKKNHPSCKLCADKKVFEDTEFCKLCVKKIVHDCGILRFGGTIIQHKDLNKWLEKFSSTNKLLFINGHFNRRPAQLLMSENILNTIPLKTFWERFKYDKLL